MDQRSADDIRLANKIEEFNNNYTHIQILWHSYVHEKSYFMHAYSCDSDFDTICILA